MMVAQYAVHSSGFHSSGPGARPSHGPSFRDEPPHGDSSLHLSVLLSRPFVAVVIGHVCHTYCMYILLSWLPSFFGKKNVVLSAFPYLLAALASPLWPEYVARNLQEAPPSEEDDATDSVTTGHSAMVGIATTQRDGNHNNISRADDHMNKASEAGSEEHSSSTTGERVRNLWSIRRKLGVIGLLGPGTALMLAGFPVIKELPLVQMALFCITLVCAAAIG